jgi:hypothetical protein
VKLRALTEVTVSGVDYVKGNVFEALPEQAFDLIRLEYAEEVMGGDPLAEPPAEPPK